MSGENIKLDPRFVGLHESLTIRLYSEKIGPLLASQGLVDNEEEQAKPPMTEEGLHLLLENLVLSTKIALSRAEIKIPDGYAFDEVELADGMLGAFGQAALLVQENDLRLTFDGPGALVESITAPLDIERALALRPEGDTTIVQVQIGKRPMLTGRGEITIGKPVGKVL